MPLVPSVQLKDRVFGKNRVMLRTAWDINVAASFHSLFVRLVELKRQRVFLIWARTRATTKEE
jgi:hypothetical protein